MRMRIPVRARPDEFAKPVRRPLDQSGTDISGHPRAEDILGEIGLVLVIVLGAVLAINAMLVSLHVSP